MPGIEMAKKSKSKRVAQRPETKSAAAAAPATSPKGKPAYELTDADREKAQEARRKNGPVRQFSSRYDDALRQLSGTVDEAMQLTVAEMIAKRHVDHLLTGRVSTHVWRGLLAEYNDRTIGRPPQSIVIKRDDFDAKTWDAEQIKAFEEFVAAHKRGPTEAEQQHYRQHGKYPDAA